MIKYNLKVLLGIINRVFLIFFISLFLNACNPEQDVKNNTNKSDEVSELQKQKIPDVVLEDLNDASSYDMARFQFQGELEGRDRKEIWSVKVDGSDLRSVLSKKELYADGFGTISPNMSRSPDNRYVMMVQAPDSGLSTEPDKGSNSRVLYDLKTRERTVIIAKGAVVPSIRWTKDSKYVMFYSWSYEDSESYLYKYNVIERKLIIGPKIHSYEFYPIKNDFEFIAITKQGFDRYDRDGNKQEEVKLEEEISSREHSVSLDGQFNGL